jgi:hypothetical protein
VIIEANLELRLSVELVIRDSMTLETGIISHYYNGLTAFIHSINVKLDERQRKEKMPKSSTTILVSFGDQAVWV